MNRKLTLGSLFSGSGSFETAALLSGIRPVWASEIEPFCIRVTTQRLPQVKHLGDISQINGADIEPVDIITFGSPCTDLSIAGKRAGLNAERSGLFFQAVRIIREMRCAANGKYPRFIVWENVTGAFSSNSGADFRNVLEEICKIKDSSVSVPEPSGKWAKSGEIMGDGFSVAYRTLDAQYWGVPQRRKRIYLVADLDGECAGKILFESEGVSGYSSESFRAWQETARGAENRSGTAVTNLILCDQGGERMDVLSDISATLRAEAHHSPCVLSSVFENHSQDSRYTDPLEVAPTLSAKLGTGGNNQPFVVEKQAYGICSKHSNSMMSDNPDSGFYKAETSRTIDTSNQSPCKNQGGMVVIEGNGSRPSHHGNGYKETDTMYTLNCTENHAVAFSQDAYDKYSENTRGSSLKASGGSYGGGSETIVCSKSEYIVRRLTPQECALLQGMPTWWCDGLKTENSTAEEIDRWYDIFETHRKAVGKSTKLKSRKQIEKWLKNPYSDSAAYKMWGNGIAMPCAWFVLSGIAYYAQNNDG
ncbi:MAG: DNA cytosine methyltransferase [Clostridium sp.]|nr:DNA cytosine methyltransferase [Clostridium sp.]